MTNTNAQIAVKAALSIYAESLGVSFIEAIELFKNNHAELITEYDRITALQKQQAAELAANPPNPKPDIIIRHWIIEPKEATTEQPAAPAQTTPTEGGQAQ